jgi:hypothetical protein
VTRPEPKADATRAFKDRVTLVAGAVGLVSMAILVYRHALGAGRWPLGHPWSGLSLGIAALNLLIFALPEAWMLRLRPYSVAALVIVGARFAWWSIDTGAFRAF